MITANSWTLLNTLMPTGRYQFAACLLDNKIYTIDGWYHSGNGPIYDKVEVYDPIDNVWTTETPMPVAVGVSDGFTMNGKIYVFGGSYTTHPLIGISDIYEFTPPIVPVELISFTSTSSGNDVILNWSTATETNNQGFEILRSTQNDNEWEVIGYVPGFGTTTEPKSYSYTDSEVFTGKHTYRLKQIDFDGSFEYSPEVEVEVSAPIEFALEQNYPNPLTQIQ
jgi:N-acetylneuraminic acid mutarotase